MGAHLEGRFLFPIHTDHAEVKPVEKQSTQIKAKGGRRPGAGRPKGRRSAKTIEIQAAAKKHAGDALKALADIAKNGESEGARVQAAQALLDRAYGKAPQAITGADGGAVIVSVVYSHE